MVDAAKIVEAENPDIIDINAGCWVKKVVGLGAGSALLRDPENMQSMAKEIVNRVSIPVTVKTRLGWDSKSILILEVAKRLEDVGVQALTVHCRTREMGHKGEADWNWIQRIKEVVNIPVVLNGNVLAPQDVKRAFEETGADAVMIARGAIGNPWIFKEAKELMTNGFISTEVNEEIKIRTCLKHLRLAIKIKGERRAVIEHRKFYTGYLKGLHNISRVRQALMQVYEYNQVEDILEKYIQELEEYQNWSLRDKIAI